MPFLNFSGNKISNVICPTWISLWKIWKIGTRIRIRIHYYGKVDPRIRIRIHFSQMWNPGSESGSESTSKWDGSETLVKTIGRVYWIGFLWFHCEKKWFGDSRKNRFNQKHLSILLPPLFSRFWEADKCVTLSNVKHVLLSLF